STDSAGLDTDGSFSVTYYERVCTDGTRAIVRREAPAEPPADPAAPPEPPPPDPEDLARELYGEMILTVPTPTIRVAPAETNDNGWVYVQHPSFFWIDEWQAISSTLTVGSISTTLTFTPSRLDIDPGDGEQVSCAAAPEFPAGSDPTTFNGCEHIYRHSSSVAPNGVAYSVEATMVWTATWTSSIGVGGNLGELSTTGTTSRSPSAKPSSPAPDQVGRRARTRGSGSSGQRRHDVRRARHRSSARHRRRALRRVD
ncbi:MAG: hypothetical protein WKF45_10965, partial [Ilumatobacteraceae bacterium]